MADYTSSQTGNWNDVATWGGGGYPGDTGAQDDTATVANTHVVTLNITALTGTCSSTVIDAGGKVIVAANFNTNDDFTGDWDVSGEIEYKKDGAGTYELRVKGTVNILTGGELDGDASGAGYKSTLSIQCIADAGDKLHIQSGATAACTGITKTVAAWISGNAAATDTDIDVDDGAAGDVSNWAVGDELVLATDDADDSHSEAVTITADNGFAAGKHNFDVDALAADHLDNSRVYNLTRSFVIQGCDASHAAIVDIDAGSTVDFDYVEFWHLDEIAYDWTTGATAKPFCGCSCWGFEASEYGFLLISATGANVNTELEECLIWGANVGSSWHIYVGLPSNCTLLLDRCYCISTNSSGQLCRTYQGARVENCELVGGRYGLQIVGDTELKECYIWACSSYAILPMSTRYCDRIKIYDSILGEDPGGHAAANGIDVDLANLNHVCDTAIFLYNSKLASASEVANIDFQTYAGRVQSVQHDQTTGYIKEWPKGGLVESNAAEDRSAPYCVSLDPSSATAGQELIWKRRFVVSAGDTPSFTFWVKDNGTTGTYTVETGDEDCGLGAVAAGSPFTCTGTYAQKTITFTNAADRDGEVEILIKIGDNAGAGTIVYIDDIAVTGV